PSAFKSAPAQKVPPAPQSTAARMAGSASTARKASASSRAVCASTALRRSVRSMITVTTAPSLSMRMAISLAPRPSASGKQRACPVSLEGRLRRELRVGVRHAKIVHREIASSRTPIALRRIQVDLPARPGREGCPPAAEVRVPGERHARYDVEAALGEGVHTLDLEPAVTSRGVAHLAYPY